MSMGKNLKVLFKPRKKKSDVQNWVWKLTIKEKEITDPREIFNNIKVFHETLFKPNSSKTNVRKQEFFNSLNIKILRNQQSDLWKMKHDKMIYLILWKVWKT